MTGETWCATLDACVLAGDGNRPRRSGRAGHRRARRRGTIARDRAQNARARSRRPATARATPWRSRTSHGRPGRRRAGGRRFARSAGSGNRRSAGQRRRDIVRDSGQRGRRRRGGVAQRVAGGSSGSRPRCGMSAFGPAQRIAGPASERALNPAVAVAADGRAIVAFQTAGSAAPPRRYRVAIAAAPPGAAFRPPITVSASRAGPPAVAIDSAGRSDVAWIRAGAIEAASRAPTGVLDASAASPRATVRRTRSSPSRRAGTR